MVLSQAEYFDADIITGRYCLNETFPGFKKRNVRVLLNRKLPWRIGSLLLRHKFMNLRLSRYDVYIYHGGHALCAARNHKNNVWYCNAPIRWIYELRKFEYARIPFYKKPFFNVFAELIKAQDNKNVACVNEIIVNSKNVQDRVNKYYGRAATVVYPQVNVDKFTFQSFGDYYLSAARLDKSKRVAMIVKAFQQMPDKKLIVASGGCMLDEVKSLASGYSNITVLGWVSEEQLEDLHGNCIANIYVPYEEDFGLVPVESMSAGKPCIVTDQGGMRETVVHGKTGYLIDATVENIIKFVKKLDKKQASRMKKSCILQAKKFSEDKHLAAVEKILKKVARKG